MNLTRTKTTVAALGLIGGALLLIPAARAQNAYGNPHVDRLVGVWQSTITQRNCASGAALATFKGMQAIHHGGTLSDTNFAPPTTRGVGFGVWQREGAGYVAKFRFARFYPDGNLAGYSVVARTITLADDGNSLTGASRIEVQDPDGVVLLVGCATDVATRMD